MTIYSRISAIVAGLGPDPTPAQLEYALRGYNKRDILTWQQSEADPKPTVISAHVTYETEGLASTDNPPVPGIRVLTDYTVPANSFVLATVHVAADFDATPSGANFTLYPLIRSTDGLTASALVDAAVGSGHPGGVTDEGITSAVDPENSIITTEATHLGVGLHTVPLTQFGTTTTAIDTDDPIMELAVSSDPPETYPFPFLVQIDDEQVTLTAYYPQHTRVAVTRAQDGTLAASHTFGAPITLVDGGALIGWVSANATSGNAFIRTIPDTTFPAFPFLVQIDDEKILFNTSEPFVGSAPIFKITRAQEGTDAASHEPTDAMYVSPPDLELTAGDAYIVFQVFALDGDLPT